jgi:uncharacterized protein with PQ loop repeat
MDPIPQRAAMSSATIISTVGWVAFAIAVLAWLFQQATQSAATAVIFACFSVWASCSAISGMLSGTVHGKYLSYSRAEKPVSFWWTVSFYAFVGIMTAFIAIRECTGFGA